MIGEECIMEYFVVEIRSGLSIWECSVGSQSPLSLYPLLRNILQGQSYGILSGVSVKEFILGVWFGF